MKKALIVLLALYAIGATGQTLSVQEILQKVEKNEHLASSEMTSRQVITTSSGKIRTLEMHSFSKDANKKQLTIYTAPSRVAGDKILMLDEGNDIWFYTPKTDRARHLASHARKQKVQGSDFSYEDMSGWNYQKDFTATLQGVNNIDGAPSYKIELQPTETGPHYSKMTVWVDKNTFIVRQVEYYEEGFLLKRLTCSNVVERSGHWLALRMEMENLQDGGTTLIEVSQVSVNNPVDDNLFLTNSLKR